GRDCFRLLSSTCHSNLSSTGNIKVAMEKTYRDNEADLGPYLGIIKSIIHKIGPHQENKFYVDTFNSLITGYELVILNFIMHTDLISAAEKQYICEFKTLSTIDETKLYRTDLKFDCNKL